MTDRGLILLSRVVAAVIVGCGVLSVIVLAAYGVEGESTASTLQELSGTLIVPAVVLIAIPRVPRNGSVWAFAAVGLSLGFVVLGDSVAMGLSGISSTEVNQFLVVESPADLPLAAAAGLTVSLSTWLVSFVLIPTMVLLLFPDGRFPAPRRWWRWVGYLTAGTIAIGMSALVWTYWPTRTTSYVDLAMDNVGGSSSASIAGIVAGVGSLVAVLLIFVSIIGYILKWKRARGEIRLQYRWVGFAFLLFAINSLLTVVLSPFGENQVSDLASWIAIVVIPVAYVVAIVKYRLYGIEIVISKTVTYGVLAIFITGVYALVVVGLGSLIGRGDEPSLALSIAAVAIVAVAFEPLRRRVQHWANVLVYGRRATPYEVLANATAQLADTRDPDEALGQVAQLVVDGTGASQAVLWLKIGDVLHPRAASPKGALDELRVATASDNPLAAVPGDRVVAVRHRGEMLGALSISKEPGNPMTAADDEVLADVAAGTGVLFRNIGLNGELAERAQQLGESRRRLVLAHDAERHRLERDLHDGAQQQVVALQVKLGIARTLAERERAESVAALVSSVAETTQEAVDEMRAVAHGIYPPLLEAEGLPAALKAAKRSVSIPLEIAADGIGRYDRAVEESIYFAVLGTIARTVDAGATGVVVALSATDDRVRFEIEVDAAPRDLVAVKDRIEAFGGTLIDTSEAGSSTITGELPKRVPSMEYA